MEDLACEEKLEEFEDFLIDYDLLVTSKKIIRSLSFEQLSNLLEAEAKQIFDYLNQLTTAWFFFNSLPNFYFVSNLTRLYDPILSATILTFSTIYLCECGWYGDSLNLHNCPTKYRMVKFTSEKFKNWLQSLRSSIDTNTCLITKLPIRPLAPLAVLSCGHAALLSPTIKWIRRYHSCFLCRQPVLNYQFKHI